MEIPEVIGFPIGATSRKIIPWNRDRSAARHQMSPFSNFTKMVRTYLIMYWLAPKNAYIHPIEGRKELQGIVIFAGHQRGAWRPVGPTIYPQEAGSERWVCLIFHPSVVLIRSYFGVHTSTYLSTGHLTHQTPVPLYPPGRNPITFSPTFITIPAARHLALAVRRIMHENYSRVNLLR